MSKPRVTVFYETGAQPQQAAYERIYPNEIGVAIGQPMEAAGLPVAYTTYGDDGCTLTPEILERTDVLFHWAHRRTNVPDQLTWAIERQVMLNGMGLVLLHSAVGRDLFQRVVGGTGAFIYRNAGERERVWAIDRAHPLTEGLEPYIELEGEEMYGEEFDIPTPDELVFISWWEGGEVFRSGCVWKRGRGKVFFFRPGHETAPTYHNPLVQRVMLNAARWLAEGKGAAPPARVPAPPPPEGRFNQRIADAAAAYRPMPIEPI